MCKLLLKAWSIGMVAIPGYISTVHADEKKVFAGTLHAFSADCEVRTALSIVGGPCVEVSPVMPPGVSEANTEAISQHLRRQPSVVICATGKTSLHEDFWVERLVQQGCLGRVEIAPEPRITFNEGGHRVRTLTQVHALLVKFMPNQRAELDSRLSQALRPSKTTPNQLVSQ